MAYGGKPLEVLNAIQQSDWELVISPEMIAELQRILKEKQKNTPAVIGAVNRYFSVAVVETPTTVIEACRDKNDNMIINCALSAGVQLLVASDNDLLDLSRSPLISKLEVINVAEAYKRFVAESSTGSG